MHKVTRPSMIKCLFKVYRLFTLIILFICFHNQAIAQLNANELRFQRLLTNTEKFSKDNISAITAIEQDALGFMWLGGENGLARYDGHAFKVYQANPNDPHALASGYIWDLLRDHDDVLWVATVRGLNRYDPVNDRFDLFVNDASNKSLDDNLVRSIAVDSHNNLYIGTSNGFSILDADRKSFQNFSHDPNNPHSLAHNYVAKVYVDSDDDVWLGTSTAGLEKFDRETLRFKHFPHRPEEPNSLIYNQVKAISEDKNGAIWIGTYGGGISVLNKNTGQFKHYVHNPSDPESIGSNTIWEIFKDNQDRQWVATDHGGLALYHPEQDSFSHSTYSPYDDKSLMSNSVRAIFQDREEDMWFGTFPTGAQYLNEGSNKIQNYSHRPDDMNSVSNNAILCFLEDSEGLLWIGTEDGLNSLDQKKHKFTRYVKELDNPNSLRFNTVLAVEEDVSGELWVGTWSGGLHRFNKQTGEFKNYFPDPNKPDGINSEYIWDIHRDKDNRIWIATETGGLNLYLPETDSFKHFTADKSNNKSINFNFVWTIMEDHTGLLWLGTLDGLARFDKNTEQFVQYHHEPHVPTSLSSNRTVSLLEDRDGRIWVGTQDRGISILDPTTGEFKTLDTRDGMPSVYIAGLVSDNQGYIWATTVNGVAKINPKDYAIRTYNKGKGLASNNHNRNATYRDKKGTLYIGGIEGFSVFNPRDLVESPMPPKVTLTGFSILNKPVEVGSPDSPLKKNITQTETLVLDHQHIMFSIYYAALSFRAASSNQYAYKLEGFDQAWNNVGNTNVATYTNLDPGKYRFVVRAANSDGLWNEDGASVDIIILPPPWLTWWAYCLYFLLIGGLIAAFIKAKMRQLELDKEKNVNAKLVKLDQLKDAFLANTSHELRTPLNGIIGLAEALADGAYGQPNGQIQHYLLMIASSGKRLSSLINDILDFSKLSHKTLSIHKRAVELSPLIHNVFSLLQPLVDKKPIQLISNISPQRLMVVADENRLQQILINLIGNAIKYTDTGHVCVYTTCAQQRVTIHVEDTGIGIPQGELQSIFQEFSQIENRDDREYGGTGLGLAITKKLVDLHGSELLVESELGRGSTFSFALVKAEGTPPPRPPATRETPTVTSFPPSLAPEPLKQQPAPLPAAESYTILIVDDDQVNRMVLASILSLHRYRTLEAVSGQEAVDKVQSHPHIDMVIMDVMMPHMTGFEACMRIRAIRPMHTLPILFLTAKNFADDLVRGFVAGGNDFLAKPVTKNEMLARINAHLTLLNNYRNQYQIAPSQGAGVENDKFNVDTLDRVIENLNHVSNASNLIQHLLNDMVTTVPGAHSARLFKYLEDSYKLNCYAEKSTTLDTLLGRELSCKEKDLNILNSITTELQSFHKHEHLFLFNIPEYSDAKQLICLTLTNETIEPQFLFLELHTNAPLNQHNLELLLRIRKLAMICLAKTETS